MMTILNRAQHERNRTGPGDPSTEEIANGEIARQHFLDYCDSSKCIRGREHARNANWHENGFCIDCRFNPYNMRMKADQ